MKNRFETKRNVWEIVPCKISKADCMYDIRWGSVGIYANYGTKEEKLLTKLSANRKPRGSLMPRSR